MSAKGIFEQVIARGGFDLTAMLARTALLRAGRDRQDR